MSRVGRCIDNGPTEGFWGIIKAEMDQMYEIRDESSLRYAVKDYLRFYSEERPQDRYHCKTPAEVRQEALAAARRKSECWYLQVSSFFSLSVTYFINLLEERMGGTKYCMFDNQDIEYIQNLLFCLIDSNVLREYREFMVQLYKFLRLNIALKKVYSCSFRSFLYRLSMQIAPKGAVMRMDKTATVNTICPQFSPIVSGIAPIAACTVALGV